MTVYAFIEPRKKFLIIPILLVLFFMGHNSWASGSDECIQFPKPSGPYSVGYKNIELTDHSRSDPYEPTHLRRLKVTAYYPSKDAAKLEPWGVDEMASWNSIDNPERDEMTADEFKSTSEEFNRVRLFQSLDAHPAAGLFPVILFEHGGGGTAGNYQNILQDLVSYGYVVLSIGHPYSSGAVVFQNDTSFFKFEEQFMTLGFKTTFEDTLFILTKLSDIKGVIPSMNLDEIGMMGHSLGGSVTIKTARLDPRIKAGISLDAPLINCFHKPSGEKLDVDIVGDFELDSGSKLDKPFLFIIADNYDVKIPHPNHTKIHLSPNNFRAVIRGTGHGSFSDEGFFHKEITEFRKRKNDVGVGAGDFSSYQPQITQLIRSFFDKFLKKDPVDLMKLRSDIVVIETGKDEPK